MDPSVYKAAESGDVGFLVRNKNGDISIDRLHQKTPIHNNIFHIAAEYKQTQFFKEVPVDDQSPLFWATNKKGNTPLHVAARVGCDEIVQFLIEVANKAVHNQVPQRVRSMCTFLFATNVEADVERGPTNVEAKNKLLRMTNLKGDTALHVAARSGHVGVVNFLMAADRNLCCFTNITNESPLFLATRQGFPLVARAILEKCPESICPSFQGINGVTALHVAVTHSDEESKGLTETMVSKYPDVVKKADALGWTPLHYAAMKGNLEATHLLTQSDSYVSYSLDKSGMSALHVAAYAGHTNVMEELIQCQPDVSDLLNHKGQTALHAAVLGGQINVIEKSLNIPKLAVLINEADEDGNTPLHLAAIRKNYEIIRKLTTDNPRVDMIAINKKLSMASDTFLSNNIGDKVAGIEKGGESGELKEELSVFGSATGLEHLGCSVGLPFFQQQITRDFWNVIPEEDTKEMRQRKSERRESRLLIATLIATVTFQAVFTVPGGLRPDNGRALLAQTVHFHLFRACNLFSFTTSTFVIFNEIVDAKLLPTRLAARLVQVSISALIIAFFTGSSAVQLGNIKPQLSGLEKSVIYPIAFSMSCIGLPTVIRHYKQAENRAGKKLKLLATRYWDFVSHLVMDFLSCFNFYWIAWSGVSGLLFF